MRKGKAWMIFSALALALPVVAAEPEIVIVSTNGANTKKIELTPTTRITFNTAEGKMILLPSADVAPMEFPVEGIEKITFDLTTNSVEDIDADLNGISIENRHGLVTITAPGEFAYGAWNANGVAVAAGNANGTVTIDFSIMPRGIYIIKANDKILKFVNK